MLLYVVLAASVLQTALALNETVIGQFNYTFIPKGGHYALNYGDFRVESSVTNPNGVYRGVFGYDEVRKVAYYFGGFRAGAWNAMWAYNENTANWRFEYGDGLMNNHPSYGPLGVFSDDYTPGARTYGAAFVSSMFNSFYVALGLYDYSALQYASDTWQYNITAGQWAFIAGSEETAMPGIYNTIGSYDIPENGTAAHPGCREGTLGAWDEESQSYYMIGGWGYGYSDMFEGLLSDVWKFDALTNRWVWIGGSDDVYAAPVYDEHGVYNLTHPGGIAYGYASFDTATQAVYFYGAYRMISAEEYDLTSDIFSYRVTDNLFASYRGPRFFAGESYGVQGVPSPSNVPFPRLGANGYYNPGRHVFTLYSGSINAGGNRWYGDLWEYDLTTGLWTFVDGFKGFNFAPIGFNGVSNTLNQSWAPGCVSEGMHWYNKKENAFYVGLGAGPAFPVGEVFLKSDVWRVIERWIEYPGVKNYFQLAAPEAGASYGTEEDPSVSPVGAQNAVWARDEQTGLVYIFGGLVNSESYNALFTFNPNTSYYRFIYGTAGANEPIVQGPLGEFGDYFPGARIAGGAFFSAAQGLFYVGLGYTDTISYLWATDMWAYHVANGTWAWVAGTEFVESPGLYGVPGIEGGNVTETYPGGRQEFAEAWDEENQYYYIVGGIGYGADGSAYGPLNDVWRFNAATWKWTFLSGSDAIGATPVYGAHNSFEAANGMDAAVLPGMRFARAGFDKTKKVMYIYSAYQVYPNGQYVNVNDLWAVRVTDGAVAYLNGTKTTTYDGVYGTRDVAAASNQPGSRYDQQVYFNEKEQALYLFGGVITLSDISRWYNDLWKYDLKTALWTWTGGSNKLNQFPVSQNVRNVPYNYTYMPGSVAGGISWYDEATERYYFGYGAGHSVFNGLFLKPDIWFVYRGFFAADKSAVVIPQTTTTTTSTTAALTTTASVSGTAVGTTAEVTSTPSSSSSSTDSSSSGTASATPDASTESGTATVSVTSTTHRSSNSTTTASGSTTVKTSTSSVAQTTTKGSQTTSRKTTTSASVIPTEDVDLGSFAAPKEQTSVLAFIGLVVALMMNA